MENNKTESNRLFSLIFTAIIAAIFESQYLIIFLFVKIMVLATINSNSFLFGVHWRKVKTCFYCGWKKKDKKNNLGSFKNKKIIDIH